MPGRPKRRRKWERRFLDVLTMTGDVSLSCREAGVSRATAYAYRDSSDRFREEWEECMDGLIDRVERAVYRGAAEGNDRLQRFVLGRRRPETWGAQREAPEQGGPDRWPTIIIQGDIGAVDGEQPPQIQ